MSRVLAWFSCGAASAVAAKLAVDEYGDRCEVLYCDTRAEEHSDNNRFMRDIEKWIGRPIRVLQSSEYTDVEDVWRKRRYMAGIAGAPCTVELKKRPRWEYECADDIHVFGLTADEASRIRRFRGNNHDLQLDLILERWSITKNACYQTLANAGIRLPEMYMLGYKNNNCIGCVKAGSPAYWAKVRDDFPEVFERRAKLSRELGARLVKWSKDERIFLDELPYQDYSGYEQEDISCGPDCGQQELFSA